MRRAPTFYRCGAGVNHYERSSTIAKWERADEQRIGAKVAAKVRAHDDYMEAMRRFRLRAAEHIEYGPTRDWQGGYRQAVHDMETALMDTMAARAQEETDDPR